MATMRTIMNRVLRTVGESQLATTDTQLTSDYQKLLAEFMNQFKEEIEDAHNWRSLRSILTATISAGATNGAVTGANERARLVREQNSGNMELKPLVSDVTTPTAPVPLLEMDLASILYKIAMDPADGDPVYFALDSNTTDGVRVYVYPEPQTERTLSLTMIVPQDYLEDDDVDVAIKIPQRPLLQGTIWFALQERGEELGQSSMFTEERYRTALDDAIARDAAEGGGLELVVV